MTLILELPAETENQLREAAARQGSDLTAYLIEKATEKLLTLEEAGQIIGVDAQYVEHLTQLELLDFRVIRGQKFIGERDLAAYEREARENPDKAMTEMVGINQLLGLYD